ncbi:hypothetical protein BLOT_012874 [Blomia tropicalis]|nr:hypothetical protein BLOT_012874 [Blomia tropicalis]
MVNVRKFIQIIWREAVVIIFWTDLHGLGIDIEKAYVVRLKSLEHCNSIRFRCECFNSVYEQNCTFQNEIGKIPFCKRKN